MPIPHKAFDPEKSLVTGGLKVRSNGVLTHIVGIERRMTERAAAVPRVAPGLVSYDALAHDLRVIRSVPTADAWLEAIDLGCLLAPDVRYIRLL